MLTFDSEKMSKSVGNIILTRDFIQKYSAEVLRFFLLSGQYRSTIDYSDKHIREVQSALHRFYSTKVKSEIVGQTVSPKDAPPTEEEKGLIRFGDQFKETWTQAMNDDFNTARVTGSVFEYVRLMNAYLDRKGFKPSTHSIQICKQFISNFKTLSPVINLFAEDAQNYLGTLKNLILKERSLDERSILESIEKRKAARKAKDFKTSDEIRDSLLKLGIELRDKGDETEWDVVFTA